MKILLIMDPGIPVPPKYYGGHERLVHLFAEEYIRRGHQVTLLAGPDSHCSGNIITFGDNDLNRSKIRKYQEVLLVWKYLIQHHHNFNLIHNFGRLIYLLPALNKAVKKIMTYGRPVDQTGIKLINSLPNKNLIFTACSKYCVSTGKIAGKWKTVYNAINFSNYQFTKAVGHDAPLMFLGRLDKIKGVHTAIKVAKATRNKLLIAGNISHTPDNYAYYKREIEPQIDGIQIEYLGPLNDAGKDRYLGQAKALLFPIEWDEPFGMVMIEAMACGTPVVAFRKGAVPEVVQEGVNGFIVDNMAQMEQAVLRVSDIDRVVCRESAKRNFDVSLVANEYLNLHDRSIKD